MFRKVLVANRGEIAIRAFRAAYELGAQTVAVFPHEDRKSEHRLKADEAYQIGERGHPVRAYLDADEIIAGRRARPAPTRSTPATASCPRTRDLAEACADAGHHVRRPAGRGAGPRPATRPARSPPPREAGRPGAARRAEPSDRRRRAASPPPTSIGFPLFVKAVAGGGGRGMRRVDDAERPARGPRGRACARRRRAFGDPTVFLEQAVVDPRHIEVQILADGDGQRHPPLRARLLGAAPAPEGRRDRPGAEPRPGAARADLRRRRRVRPRDRLRQRRHGRVPARPATAATSSSR